LYWLRIEGSGVVSGTARYDLLTTVVAASSDGALTFEDMPASVGANQPVTFTERAEGSPSAGQRALLLLGPPLLSNVVKVSLSARVGAPEYLVYLPVVGRPLD
jgi:hypothetical protein